MNYNVEYHENFAKEVKVLVKKYPSLKKDLQKMLDNIEKELSLADDLGNGFKKIRLNITSKGKGKRGGGRIIIHETIITVSTTKIVLGSIYDKSEYDTINISLLRQILDI